MSTIKTTPPVKCTPCRVKYDGAYFRIKSNGDVYQLYPVATDPLQKEYGKFYEADIPCLETEARDVRREASRLRRNRNTRERTQAMKDLGLVRAKGGAFGGWE